MPGRARLLHLSDHSVIWPSGLLHPADFSAIDQSNDIEVHHAFLFGAPSCAHDSESRFYRLALSERTVSWNPLARRSVTRLFEEVSPDVVIVTGPWSRILGLAVAEALGIAQRLVIACDLAPWLTAGLIRQIRRADALTTLFVADSRASVERLIGQEGVRRDLIAIHPWGIDFSHFPPRSEESVADSKHRLGLSTHQSVILCAGPAEDYQIAFHALRQLLPHQRQALLLIHGGAIQAHPAIGEWITDSGLSEHVIVTSADVGLRDCIAAADVGVVTTLFDSVSVTLLQYQASGLPCIAVNVGGHAELIRHGETGYLVSLKDPDQLAMFVTILLLSPELASRFSGAALQNLRRNYSMEAALHCRNELCGTVAASIV